MPKHFVIEENIPAKSGKVYTYFREAWYEQGRKAPIKKPLYDSQGKPFRSKKEAEFYLWGRSNGQGVSNERTTIKEFLPDFEAYLRDKGKKELSITLYKQNIERAVDSLPHYLQDIKREHIDAFISSLSYAPATKTKYAKSLCRLFKIARFKGKIKDYPMEGWEYHKHKTIINPYSEDEIKKLIDAARGLEKESKEPYYTFIIFALQTGLRLDEYVNLRWKYLDFKKGEYYIRIDETWRPKHDHERTIKIPKLSLSLLKKLPQDSEYIFHKRNGKRHDHFTRDFVNAIFKACDIEGDLHQIRKTFASYRLEIQGNQYLLKEHLGHESLKELEAYIGRVPNISKSMRELFRCY